MHGVTISREYCLLALLLDQTQRESTYEIYECKSDSLVEELQEDVQTGNLYIPAKKRQHRSWGNDQAIEKSWKSVIQGFFQILCKGYR